MVVPPEEHLNASLTIDLLHYSIVFTRVEKSQSIKGEMLVDMAGNWEPRHMDISHDL